MTKKLLPVFLLCFLLAAGLLSAVSAANDDIVDSGDCGIEGNNVTWTLDNKGALTISGTGDMDDYMSYKDLRKNNICVYCFD
ncbi:MAG: hypothetical protein IJK52_04670 [Oscillospiraceae bacterium]|nr:hypothetical protein [Oscillospiraceae bacterium]